MQYDLHVHTAEYSPCSSLRAEDACRLAAALGMRGIGITEHDLWWPATELAGLRTRHPDLIIFNGVECTCREGHFLVFLPAQHNEFAQPPDTIKALAPWAHARRGIVIWAHPFRFEPFNRPPWLETVALDGIETASRNMQIGTRELAAEIAAELELRSFTNSDAHQEDDLGYYTNAFGADITSVEALIQFVKRPSSRIDHTRTNRV